MNQTVCKSYWRWLLLAVLIGTCLGSTAFGQRRKIKSFRDVETIVNAHFKSIKGFEEGDLVTQSATQQLFVRLQQYGWRVADQREIISLTLPDGDILVKTFKSSKGRKFLQKISQYKEGIDRIDRIARMPHGHDNVRDLVYKVPNGSDWIKALTSNKNGKQVSQRMAGTRHGKDFNKPTGKIYQVENLVERLMESYQRAQTKTVHNYRTR